jgi:hypothetical protein
MGIAQADKVPGRGDHAGGFDAPANPFAFRDRCRAACRPNGTAQSPTSYPWCARYYKEGAPTSCYFASYQQCMTTLSGIGGYCYESPYYHAAQANASARPRRQLR